jgi:Ubiquitin-like domain
LDTKVDKASGKDLSTNDYTSTEKTKLAAITGTNTGDQDLSLYATASSVSLKLNTADLTASLANKVDKLSGKGLSTNDYTSTEKTKLAAITGSNTGDQDLSLLATSASVALKENQSNKSADPLLGGTNANDILFPSQKAVKSYVAANAASGGIADGGITNIKIADLSVTDAKIADVAASKITGTLGVAHGGTGATTLTGLVKGNGTGAFTAATAGTDYLAPDGSAANLTTFPTFNQNTTGNAATATKLAATKNINGVAFDGSSDIVIPAKFTNDVKINLSGGKSLGKYPNGATIPAAGKTLDEFLLDLVTESIHPTYNAPSVSISSDKTASYEIGADIGTVTLSSSFNQNNGGTATGTTYFKNGGSLGAGVRTNNHGVLSTSISYSVTVTYGAGTVVLNDNLGNPDATGQIAAGSTSSSLTISPYANKYFGTSASNSIDDATLRAGINEVASGKAKSNFNVAITGGTKYIFYAYPASLGAISSISVEGFGSLDAFTLTTRNVTNASGHTQSYNIYISNNSFASDVNNIIIN